MGAKALSVQQLSKKYTLGTFSSASFRDYFSSLFSPSDKSLQSAQPKEFWALKDLSFDIEKGDVVGIIGRNGAGKSTLLKIISNITKPTSGQVDIYGRIASLLEVGTGFHPELTGRENIFLNGTILGMTRSEVFGKLEEIIEFSGISSFIDTPVKRYSSGMSVRLAFAVAAHLDPEILIVDEVLAVGDADFQKKCLGKMNEVSRKEGRTILFVSHSLPALKAICRKGILLERGELKLYSSINETIERYSASVELLERRAIDNLVQYVPDVLELRSLKMNGNSASNFNLESGVLNLEMEICFHRRMPFELDLHIKKDEVHLASYANFVYHDVAVFEPGVYRLHYQIVLPELLSGLYTMDMYFTEPFVRRYAGLEGIVFEKINEKHSMYIVGEGMVWGKVLMSGEQKFQRLS